IASGIAVLLACVVLPRAITKRLGGFLLSTVSVVALAVGLMGSGVIALPGGGAASQALVLRATSIFSPDETLDTASLQWRVFVVGGAFTYFRMPDGPTKLVTLAVVGSFIGLLEWTIFEPHLMLPAGMATVGIMVGLVAVAASGSLEHADGERSRTRPRGISS